MSSLSDQVSLKSKVAGLLGVERGETPTLGLMVALNFVISIAFVLVQTTSYGLFIDEFGSQNLPFAYLSVAVLASAVAYAYLKLSERVSYRAAQYVNLGFLVLVCLVFWRGLSSGQAHWFIFLLPFWFQALVNLANLIIWHSAGHLYNVRQAKRLYGLVGAGNWLANIFGGLAVAALLIVAGAPNLYLLAAIALVTAALVLRPILGRLPPASGSTGGQGPSAPVRSTRPTGSPFRHRYSRLIFAYTLLWWMGFFVIDNIFFDRAGIEFPAAAQLASFLGKQLSVMGVIAIVTTSFLTSRIVGRYGMRAALLIMPLIVTVCALLMVTGGALDWAPAALFWIATAAKTLNVALGFSLSLAAGALLFQPLLGSLRSATQIISEGIVQPVAIGLAGLLLLLFNTFLHFNAVGLSYVFLVIAAFWLWVTVRVSQEYPRVLGEAVRKRSLGESTSLLFDPVGLAQLQNSLQSPRAAVVLYAINQLEQLDPRAWHTTLSKALPGLLSHPAPEVRLEAVRRIPSLQVGEALPLIRSRLGAEATPEVFAMLIQVLAAHADEVSAPQIAEALDSQQTSIRAGAIVGSLVSSSTTLFERAKGKVLHMVESPEAADRALAAEVLAESTFPGSKGLVARLLSDPDATVRKAAVRAAGRQGDSVLLNRLIDACDDPETAPVAERMLISKGAASITAISNGLRRVDTEPLPRQRVESLMRVLGHIEDPKALDLLRSNMDTVDPDIRLQVLRALSAHRFRAHPVDRVPDRITSEVAYSAWLAGAIQTLEGAGGQKGLSILQQALESAFAESRARVLMLLSYLYDAKVILRAEQALDGAAAQRSAYAAEAVDAQLPAHLKPLVMPLVETFPFGRRLALWQSAGLQSSVPGFEALIEALIDGPSESRHSKWIRMCAIHAAAMLNLTSFVPALQTLQSASDVGLGRTAQWGLRRLSSGAASEGENEMLSLVEKVIILKSARLFGETPDKVLADVAGLADEIVVDKDQVIFNKGEAGDSLYIIVTGAVEVTDGSRLLNRLGEGDIFGELALLDPEPRVATVRSTEPTQLLRLDEAHFRVILAERPEVSSAIIRVITRYLRGLLRAAGDLDANLPGSKPYTPATGAPEAAT